MSPAPNLLAKAGFGVLRVKGSHHFLRHLTGGAPLCQRIPVKPSVPASFTRSFGIAK